MITTPGHHWFCGLGRVPVRVLVVVVAAALAAGCAGTAAPPGDTTSGDNPPAGSANGRFVSVPEVFRHVHGVSVDPADGRVYIASHNGLFRAAGDGRVERAGTTGRDLMGFTIAGPATFLSSGHPGPNEETENPLGLVQSTDAGTTWTPISLAGEVDFHALEVSTGTIYGLGADGALRASADGGRTWQDRPALAALDIAVHPTDPAVVLASVEGGTAASTDGAVTFAAPTGPQLSFLSWAPDGTVYGLDLDGVVHASADRGATWQPRGTVPGGRPSAVTGLDGGRMLAATSDGVYDSRDGGRTLTRIA